MSKLFAEGTQAMASGRNTDFLEITTFETGAFREREPKRQIRVKIQRKSQGMEAGKWRSGNIKIRVRLLHVNNIRRG